MRGQELIEDAPWREISEINAPGQYYLPEKMAGFTSDDPRVASHFQAWLRERGAVFPLKLKSGGMVDVDFAGRNAAVGQFASQAHKPTYDAVMSAVSDTANGGVIMRNTGDEGTVFVPRNPEQLRSRFARFDPRLAHLRNLSAGVAGLGMLNALAAPDQEAEAQAIRNYLAGL
jgi:hypothetical protein